MARTLTHAEYVSKAAVAAPTVRVKGFYTRSHDKILHRCKVCRHEWHVSPNSVLNGNGCPRCGRILSDEGRSRGRTYDARLNAVHAGTIVRVGPYTKSANKTLHHCVSCGHQWFPLPSNLLRGVGCPQCQQPQNKRFSHSSLQWLTYEENLRGIVIQHAGRGKEFVPPGTMYRVDGYHAETNTIFEYYGDAVHGNLKVFAKTARPSWWHPTKTAEELFKATKKRERHLRRLGYTVVAMWEFDWKRIHRYERVT